MKLTHHVKRLLGAGAVLAFALSGCAAPPPASTPGETSMDSNTVGTAMPEMTMTNKAVAVIHPTKGNKVQGTVTFTQEDAGLHIVADITGLTPGKHGFHAHENGDCSAEDGSSAGGHFNPEDMKHGAPDDAQRHVGDFGNITADASGKAHLDTVDKIAKLNGKDSIVGHAIIIHGKADDLKSQPSGDAGPRVACGVVGVAK
jgi:Cu-Zn family superoxide dismutase